jgi:hypothetical protein
MKRYGLVVQEETITEGAADAEAEPTIAEVDSENEDEYDDNILSQANPAISNLGNPRLRQRI